MIDDSHCAILCDAIYAAPGGLSIKWDYLDPGDDDGICWGLLRMLFPDASPIVGASSPLRMHDVVCFRGSATFTDWFRDLIALANPFVHDRLGPVHPGFLLGMEHAWKDIRPLLKNPLVVTGHSLGAGRAAILCGLAIADGVVPVKRVCFGEPKPGFRELATLLEETPGVSYRNGGGFAHDLVTDVPFSFPPEEYIHPTPLTYITNPPVPGHEWGIFAWHSMALYRGGVLSPSPSPILTRAIPDA
jgi:hypothetical protein